MKSMVKRIKWALQNPHTYNQKKGTKIHFGALSRFNHKYRMAKYLPIRHLLKDLKSGDIPRYTGILGDKNYLRLDKNLVYRLKIEKSARIIERTYFA